MKTIWHARNSLRAKGASTAFSGANHLLRFNFLISCRPSIWGPKIGVYRVYPKRRSPRSPQVFDSGQHLLIHIVGCCIVLYSSISPKLVVVYVDSSIFPDSPVQLVKFPFLLILYTTTFLSNVPPSVELAFLWQGHHSRHALLQGVQPIHLRIND